MRELHKESGSHLFAAISGFTYVASIPDFAAVILANAYLQTHTEEKPNLLPLPFAEPEKEKFSEEVIEEYSTLLTTRSAIQN